MTKTNRELAQAILDDTADLMDVVWVERVSVAPKHRPRFIAMGKRLVGLMLFRVKDLGFNVVYVNSGVMMKPGCVSIACVKLMPLLDIPKPKMVPVCPKVGMVLLVNIIALAFAAYIIIKDMLDV